MANISRPSAAMTWGRGFSQQQVSLTFQKRQGLGRGAGAPSRSSRGSRPDPSSFRWLLAGRPRARLCVPSASSTVPLSFQHGQLSWLGARIPSVTLP